MTRIKIACAALAVPFLLGSCVTDRAETTSETMATMEASADEMEEELDPNDPDVLQCPVTGALQRRAPLGDGADEHHGGMDF